MAYIPDHCPTALGPGPEGWGEYHPDALALAAGPDLLIHDAFLRPDEVAAQASFGPTTSSTCSRPASVPIRMSPWPPRARS